MFKPGLSSWEDTCFLLPAQNLHNKILALFLSNYIMKHWVFQMYFLFVYSVIFNRNQASLQSISLKLGNLHQNSLDGKKKQFNLEGKKDLGRIVPLIWDEVICYQYAYAVWIHCLMGRRHFLFEYRDGCLNSSWRICDLQNSWQTQEDIKAYRHFTGLLGRRFNTDKGGIYWRATKGQRSLTDYS